MSTLANWTGNFKERYHKFINPLAEQNSFAEHLEYIPQEFRPGLGYNVAVVTRNEHGQTADITSTAFAFKSAIDSKVENARLDGATVGIVGNVPYDVSFKGNNGAGQGNQGGAFWKPYDLKVKMLVQSANLYRELLLMYGAGGAAFTTAAANIGVFATTPTPAGTYAAGTATGAITVATNAPGLWNMMLGAKVDIYNGSTLSRSAVEVKGYNPETGLLTLGDHADATGTGAGTVPVAGYYIVPHGWLTKSAVGLQAQLSNTTTMFGIDAATVPMWRPIQLSVGGAMTANVITGLAARLANNGGRGGKLFVSPATFADLVKDTIALQRYTENTAKVKRQGAGQIAFETPVGPIEVVAHRYMKQSIAFFLPDGLAKRVGSTDVTFKGDGPNEFFFLELPSNAGYQLRVMQNQSAFIEIPYHAAILTGIVNSTTSGATGGVA